MEIIILLSNHSIIIQKNNPEKNINMDSHPNYEN